MVPFSVKTYDSVAEVEDNIQRVSELLKVAAREHLPRLKFKKENRRWFDDHTLANLSVKSHEVWARCKDAGKPANGTLYEQKNKLWQEVRKRIKMCMSSEERKRLQSFDMQFKNNQRDQFKLLKRRIRHGTKVRVNGQISTDPDQVLEAWVNHFKDTSRSRAEEKPSVAEAICELPSLVSESYANLETVLDYPFTFEEVEGAIHRFKARKAGGADNIQPEQIKFGGQKHVMWLLLNCRARGYSSFYELSTKQVARTLWKLIVTMALL